MAVLLSQPLAAQSPQLAINRLNELLSTLQEPSALSQYHLGFFHEQAGEVTAAEHAYKSCLRLPSQHEPVYTNVRPLLGLCRLAISRAITVEPCAVSQRHLDSLHTTLNFDLCHTSSSDWLCKPDNLIGFSAIETTGWSRHAFAE